MSVFTTTFKNSLMKTTTPQNHLSKIISAIRIVTGVNEIQMKEKTNRRPNTESRYIFSDLAKNQLRWVDNQTANFLEIENRCNIVYFRKKHLELMHDKKYSEKYKEILLILGPVIIIDSEPCPGIEITEDKFKSSKLFDKSVRMGSDLY